MKVVFLVKHTDGKKTEGASQIEYTFDLWEWLCPPASECYVQSFLKVKGQSESGAMVLCPVAPATMLGMPSMWSTVS